MAVPLPLIRRAQPGDAPILATLRADSAHERKGGDRALRDAFEQSCAAFFSRELADARSFLQTWIALVDGEVVGAASLANIPTFPRYGATGFERDGRVRDVYVVPSFRRRGIARALMLAVLDGAAAAHVDRLSLGTSEMGAPLYRSIGFSYKPDEMVYSGALPAPRESGT